MTHNTREVEEVVYALFVEHIEELMNEAEMAVRYEVKDKEQYYERLRTGSRSLVDAIRTTLHHQLQKAREEERERIAERVRKGRFSKVANDEWNDDNTFGYKEALKDVAEYLENHSELDQDNT